MELTSRFSLSTRGQRIFLLAVILRVAVFFVLGPTGADDHYEVIDYILRNRALPTSGVFAQSFHPPAYYVLSVPWALLGGPRFVEVFSLLLSIVNLWILFALVEASVSSERARLHAMLLLALLPQFVLYGILVSNDSLAMLVGTLCLFAAVKLGESPTVRTSVIAGAFGGLALLTKGTLIPHAVILTGLVVWKAWKSATPARAALMIASCLTLTLLIGSYKFLENERVFGKPVVHNMEFGQGWVTAQRPTITGFRSLVDIDLRKILKHPYSELHDGRETNPQSVPLLFYATLWHPYVTVSNFRGSWERTNLIAQSTYVLAVVPTLLIAGGLVLALRRTEGRIPIVFLAGNAAVVLAAGVQFDAWSCFQSRLLFPSMASIALAYSWAGEWLAAKSVVAASRFTDACAFLLYFSFAVFFLFEGAHVALKVLG